MCSVNNSIFTVTQTQILTVLLETSLHVASMWDSQENLSRWESLCRRHMDQHLCHTHTDLSPCKGHWIVLTLLQTHFALSILILHLAEFQKRDRVKTRMKVMPGILIQCHLILHFCPSPRWWLLTVRLFVSCQCQACRSDGECKDQGF